MRCCRIVLSNIMLLCMRAYIYRLPLTSEQSAFFFFISVHHASSYLADERTVAVVVCAPQPLATVVGYVHRTVATDCTPRLPLYTTTGHLRPATSGSTENDTFETPRNYPFFPIVYAFFIIIFISPRQ